MLNIKDLKKNIDYEKLGLMCGLEIHQQLNCDKLFSTAKCEILPNSVLDKSITRKLRFSTGESGTVDSVAVLEFKLGKYNTYWYNNKCATLVELDETPPTNLNQKAFTCALQISQTFNLDFFDKIQFMRKLIIDGSCVSGFQRTALLGINGKL